MKIEEKCKLMANTLSLIGLNQTSFEVDELSQWKGIGVTLCSNKNDSSSNIRVMVTKSYCGCTGKPTGVITIMNKEGDDIDDNIDLLIEKIINKLA